MGHVERAVGGHVDVVRSSRWRRVEMEHLARHPHCAACKPGSHPASVQVHHVFPHHYCVALGRPELELDPRNLITLCETEFGHAAENHHLLLGHLNDFRSSNLEVERAARIFRGMPAAQIVRHPEWLAQRHGKLPYFDQMTERHLEHVRHLMYMRFPRRP